jgi:hypothetical protein
VNHRITKRELHLALDVSAAEICVYISVRQPRARPGSELVVAVAFALADRLRLNISRRVWDLLRLRAD